MISCFAFYEAFLSDFLFFIIFFYFFIFLIFFFMMLLTLVAFFNTQRDIYIYYIINGKADYTRGAQKSECTKTPNGDFFRDKFKKESRFYENLNPKTLLFGSFLAINILVDFICCYFYFPIFFQKLYNIFDV